MDLEYCLQYLSSNHYNFVSLEQIILHIQGKATLPKRPVAFTIDDGFEDQASIGAPIFLKYNCPVTIFLISDFLDGILWPWDDQVAYLVNHCSLAEFSLELNGQYRTFNICDNREKATTIRDIQNWIKTLPADKLDDYLQLLGDASKTVLPATVPDSYKAMSWQQARQLEKQGVRFAPHTRSHRILSRLDNHHAKNEILHSWQRLSEELASPSPVFCYPTGRAEDFTDRDIAIIKDTNLIGAVSTEPTFVDVNNLQSDYIYRLPRFGFPDTFEDFLQYSSWIERAKTQLLNR